MVKYFSGSTFRSPSFRPSPCAPACMGELWLAPSPPSGIRTLPGDPDAPDAYCCSSVHGVSSSCDNERVNFNRDSSSVRIGAPRGFGHEHGHVDGRIEKGQKKRGEGEGLSDHPTDDCFFGEIGFVKRRRIHESGLQRASGPSWKKGAFQRIQKGTEFQCLSLQNHYQALNHR